MKASREKLELAMARACMNATDIAKKSGMPEPTVKNVISGRNVKPRTFGRFAQVLNCDPSEIIEKED